MINDTKYARAFKILKIKEYSNRPDKFLHSNKNEEMATLGGLYRLYNPQMDWEFVDNIVASCDGDIERASVLLHSDDKMRMSVFNAFKKSYWDVLKLDEIQSNIICINVFLSAVHVGTRRASKIVQKVVKASVDGIIGANSVKAINNFDEDIFERIFKKEMIIYYNKVIENKPELEDCRSGFYSRLNFDIIV